MLNPTEVNSAFSHVVKIVKVVLAAHSNVSHDEVARQAIKAYGEKHKQLEDQLTGLLKRKNQDTNSTKAAVNTKRGAIGDLDALEPILQAMMNIMREQGKPQVVAGKKAA